MLTIHNRKRKSLRVPGSRGLAMATAAEALDLIQKFQDELTCCLCLDYFQNPVSIINCSHSFCKKCIAEHCKKNKASSCPQCRGVVQLDNLVPNRSLANVIETVQQIAEKQGTLRGKPERCQKPLEFFWNYHEAQNQKLSAGLPTHYKEEVKINEVAKQFEINFEAVTNREEDIAKIEDYVCQIRSSVTENFSVIKKHINDQEKVVLGILDQVYIEAQQKTKIMTDQLLEMQNNSEEQLKNTSSEQEAYIGPIEVNEITLAVQKIKNIACDVEKLRRQLEKTELGKYLGQSLQEPSPGTSKIHKIQKKMTKGEIASNNFSQNHESLQEASRCSSARTRAGDSPVLMTSRFSEWTCDVTFDLQRIHCCLQLSEDKKRVFVSQFLSEYEPSPERFRISQVMGSQSFSEGCHYWEVSTRNCAGWAVGIAYGEIGKNDILGRTELSWCVEWTDGKNQLSAWHKNQETLLDAQKPLQIGVLLNIRRNCLSFYSLTNKETCLYEFEIKLVNPVYPAFWLFAGRKGEFLTIVAI